MNTRNCLLFLLVGLSGTGCTLVKVAPMVPEIIGGLSRAHSIELDAAYDRIRDGKFDAAEKVLKQLELGKPTPLLTSEIAYIRALIAERKGARDEAIAKYQAVIAEYPHTPDAYLAAKKLQQLEATRPPVSTP